MKRVLAILLATVLSLTCIPLGAISVSAYTGSSQKEKTADTNVRVMSYNVLVDNDETLGGWSWGHPLGDRGNKASACIDYYRPDVIGFQECNYNWHVALKANLPDYAFVNADVPDEQHLENPEHWSKEDWMCTTMMYNTKTLTLLENELIGYSVNYWGCIQRMRYISMALFEIKETGARFVFISTHLDAEKDSKGQANRIIQTGELVECIQRYKEKYGYPIISTGDYNSSYSDAPIQQLVASGMSSHESNRGGIDYILYSSDVTASYFTAVNDSDVVGASDHKPIMVDLAGIDHSHNFDDVCDSTCDSCGFVRVDVHNYIDATCTTPKTCTICGATDGDALGHTASTVADCTNAQVCTVCGIELAPVLGHSHHTVVTAPDCVNDGYTTYTCACGDSYVADEIAALGHAYDNEFDTDCNVCGGIRKAEVVLSAVSGGCSIREDEDGIIGLAAKFYVSVVGLAIKDGKYTQADYTNAYMDGYKLITMGVIASNGSSEIDIPVKYLMELDETSASFAARIINISADKQDVEITFRSYFVLEVDGVAVTVYGPVQQNSYNGVLSSVSAS